MMRSSGATIACAASGSSASISAVEPLRSANSAVTILRSPSIVVEASACSEVTRILGAADAALGKVAAADSALPGRAAPQSSQNADAGAFCAPHFGQPRDSGLPHAAQNFLLVVLSVPHLVQRMRLILRDSDGSPSFIIQ